MTDPGPGGQRLVRRLGLADAVTIGLGAMLGAGVFAAFAPAARAAGTGLLIGLLLAAVVAYCNATSSARLAALYPESGGTYVYGRRRLGDLWGYLAGWAFVVGKTASCAAMALTFAAYAVPDLARPVAVLAVVGLTAVNYAGVQKSARLTRVIVGITVVVLALVVVAAITGGTADAGHLSGARSPGDLGIRGVLESAGLLFFAFAGYARIATLGEEVRDPGRTIPRAIPIALLITLCVYVLVAIAVLLALGPDDVAASPAPLRAAVEIGSFHALGPVVSVGAAVAALGSLLALILGVSRTTLAMARDGHLPRSLAEVHPRRGTPHRAELTVAAVVIALVLVTDLRGAIGFSSFGVLVYYAIANACALTLSRTEGRPPRIVPVLGLVGCLVLAFLLPGSSVLAGSAVLVVGLAIWAFRRVAQGRA